MARSKLVWTCALGLGLCFGCSMRDFEASGAEAGAGRVAAPPSGERAGAGPDSDAHHLSWANPPVAADRARQSRETREAESRETNGNGNQDQDAEDRQSRTPAANGWLEWRGPQQAGMSKETGLVERWVLDGENHLWTKELSGRGTPVVANGRIYAWGYRGQGRNLQEVLACLDPETGETIWEQTFNDFLSDVIYNRYSIGAPSVDPETGNIYLLTTAGQLVCISPEGERLWNASTMERFGTWSFPNGRTGAPAIDGDLVIIHKMAPYWGPMRDRFFAFDKKTGENVWITTANVGKPFLADTSFGTPVFAFDERGRRVFYAGTGSGNIVCINSRTGEPIWRYQMAIGGLNSSVVVHGDLVIAVNGKENPDSSNVGGMVAIDRTNEPEASPEGTTPKIGKDAVVWSRDDISMFTSSPVLAEGRVYQIDATGVLHCVNAETGEKLWEKKLGAEQLHASPLWADGKLYVPMNDGTFYILRPSDEGAEVLSETELSGDLLGAPSVWNGRFYVFSLNRLYSFGEANCNEANLPEADYTVNWPGEPGEVAQLQPVPFDVLLEPGETRKMEVRGLDENGRFVKLMDQVEWSQGKPPLQAVETSPGGELTAKEDAKYGLGRLRVSAGGAEGMMRGRVLPAVPFEEDFESFELTESKRIDEGEVQVAGAPSAWVGAGPKWTVREVGGSKVLSKTLDRIILQRAVTFIGQPDASGYVMRADVMTGERGRLLGDVGIINQRYLISLNGNQQALTISSNYARMKVGTDFTIEPNTWYTIKARVDVAEDGSGVVRAKAWPRDEQEPEQWMLEAPHRYAHRKGSPGVFALAPQNLVRVYVDNIKVAPSKNGTGAVGGAAGQRQP